MATSGIKLLSGLIVINFNSYTAGTATKFGYNKYNCTYFPSWFLDI